MAVTRLMPLHCHKGKTVAATLKSSIAYITNPNKTEDGALISAYECDEHTADLQFLLAQQQYAATTGKQQSKSSVIAYHVRQSFKPSEVSPAEANKIGYELAMRLTKGKHAFLVCTHTDRHCVHSHIIFNSVTLDCTRKYRNFLGSAFALRRISDTLCVEHGLSIVENPSKNYCGYDKWLGSKKALSYQDQLKLSIDAALKWRPATFEIFLDSMRAAGYTINTERKHITFLFPGQKRPTRCDTLRGDYTEAAIRERIDTKRYAPLEIQPVKAFSATPSLLIDIQERLKQGKGPGFERWAKKFNLKQMSQTLIYLKEKGLNSYDELKAKADDTTSRTNDLMHRVKSLESQLTSNAELQKHIVSYSKTRNTYLAYEHSGYSKKFLSQHEPEILIHQAARKAFDSLGVTTLPTIKSLRASYSALLEEKKNAERDYRIARGTMKELLIAKANVDSILEISKNPFPERTLEQHENEAGR